MKKFFSNLKVFELAGVLAGPSVGVFFALISCSPQTNSVIFFSTAKQEIKSIGIVPLYKKTDYYDTLFPWLRKNYDSITTKEFKRQIKLTSIIVPFEVDYFNPDKEDIKRLCSEKGLDAICISNIDFTKVLITYAIIPLNTYYDHILRSKIFDKNGNFIYHVSTSTGGNKKIRNFKNETAFQVSVAKNVELIDKLIKIK